MLFQSWQYLILLLAAMAVIFLVKSSTVKRITILALSLFFYAYGGQWQTLLFIAVIAAAYGVGILLDKKKNKWILTLCIIGLFSPLMLYKYIPFLFNDVLSLNVHLELVLPIGISFYSFQAVGYVIDVYRGKSKPERNFITFACFISFFPQLVAGPIERSGNLMEQIRRLNKPSSKQLSAGFRHILLGLCLKLLIAETMARFVDPVYNSLPDRGGLAVLIATVFFGIQIYCDFNGYTQIAIGSAKLMGIDLMQNFDHPYRAHSISDFWRRWHISLTSWFRDYLYIPLGGNRKGKLRTALNSVITFFVSGLWHGANWTFALWGLVNGVSMAVEKQYLRPLSKRKWLAIPYSILTYVLVTLFWVLFRANSLSDALVCYKLIFTDTLNQLTSLTSFSAIYNFFTSGSGWSTAAIFPLAVSLFIYLWYEYGMRLDLTGRLTSNRTWVRWLAYVLLIFATLYFGSTLAQSDFVYFRF